MRCVPLGAAIHDQPVLYELRTSLIQSLQTAYVAAIQSRGGLDLDSDNTSRTAL
jgi:hypothetical protein